MNEKELLRGAPEPGSLKGRVERFILVQEYLSFLGEIPVHHGGDDEPDMADKDPYPTNDPPGETGEALDLPRRHLGERAVLAFAA